ncbi:hypothetical protein HMN09_00570500 [Mycena chlorophos]|uniref:Uncharacterized protein n=1 Tax=Mycena chlorophos TaxID=658473 RepID=A0A8H6WCY9_MYCCL|nr:hypothetical protein HMN09_00570500 [Mycena chlorophos]
MPSTRFDSLLEHTPTSEGVRGRAADEGTQGLMEGVLDGFQLWKGGLRASTPIAAASPGPNTALGAERTLASISASSPDANPARLSPSEPPTAGPSSHQRLFIRIPGKGTQNGAAPIRLLAPGPSRAGAFFNSSPFAPSPLAREIRGLSPEDRDGPARVPTGSSSITSVDHPFFAGLGRATNSPAASSRPGIRMPTARSGLTLRVPAQFDDRLLAKPPIFAPIPRKEHGLAPLDPRLPPNVWQAQRFAVMMKLHAMYPEMGIFGPASATASGSGDTRKS